MQGMAYRHIKFYAYDLSQFGAGKRFVTDYNIKGELEYTVPIKVVFN